MGGEGSGRKPDPFKHLMRQPELKTPIGAYGSDPMFLPNLSGISSHPEVYDISKLRGFGVCPRGSIIAFHTSAINLLVADPDEEVLDKNGNRTGWFFCNGQVIDAPSDGYFDGGVMELIAGQLTLPDLNVTPKFIRGTAGTTGGTAGSNTHSHTATTDASATTGNQGAGAATVSGSTHVHTLTTTAEQNIPVSGRFAWIIRIY